MGGPASKIKVAPLADAAFDCVGDLELREILEEERHGPRLLHISEGLGLHRVVYSCPPFRRTEMPCVDAVGVDGKRRILSNKLRKRGTAVVDVDDVDLGRNRV